MKEIILFALVIVLFIVGCCILAVAFLLLKVLTNGGLGRLAFVTIKHLLVLVIVLLIAERVLLIAVICMCKFYCNRAL